MIGYRAIIALVLLTGISLQASATISDSISFGGWISNDSVDVTPSFTVGIDDGGFFVVDVWIDADSDYLGKISGIFFDLRGFNVIDNTVGTISGPHYTDFATDTNKINGVTNIGVGGNANFDDFDVALGYKPFANSAISLKVENDNGLTLRDWTRVGVRWQATTNYEEDVDGGSDKVVAIPEPGSMALLTLGLLALSLSRTKRSRA